MDLELQIQEVETLRQFYTLMNWTRDIRAQIVELYINEKPVPHDYITSLQKALELLINIPPRKETDAMLILYESKRVTLDLTYEINELRKDLYFLRHTEEQFYDYLGTIHDSFAQEYADGVSWLKSYKVKNFISDRDGTVNNYCGRYASSIQSIYNAVFLARFAANCAENAILLTSAPLDHTGLVDLSVLPPNYFVFAGSKGREYVDKERKRRTFPIKPEKEKKLEQLNSRLKDLVKQPAYEKFGLIGSGLQFKFGQTTIARQDISQTISAEESEQFLDKIREIVADVDKNREYFRIEDTGMDIEIILTIQKEEMTTKVKDFDKGDGVEFLDKDLPLHLEQGTCLVCGDTKSDVPMVSTSVKTAQQTRALFVINNGNDDVRSEVMAACPQSFFVSEPDTLVAILNDLGRNRN